MQNKLKWYIRQSIANFLRNEIRKDQEKHNKLDHYYSNIEKINNAIDKTADEMIKTMDTELEILISVYGNI